MTEIVVVYELDRPGASGGADRGVRAVHAATTAPGRLDATGPRTLCGKDTFAMDTARWKPSEHPGAPWYPTEHASVVCPDCDAVMAV
ncbi:hypothetical protein GQF42_31575 [Streptomyces broussonetiae]|uniref:Uncharacterized protein n=1 Tax=Streptomyces broussonetiae TaxID=2686304 RepID=A0A6I6N9P1_9ACTN|nr:hypothetical protein [Streptomyces broussonetiae]QHA07241.1 hypothetical protein GQF42_31575 [Streptomyces broussonetiae]